MLAGPGSELFRERFDGDIAAYTEALSEVLVGGVAPNPYRHLRVVATTMQMGDLYDSLCAVHALLVAPSRRLSRGQYMTPSGLARWFTRSIPLGTYVADTGAGMGMLLAAARSTHPHCQLIGCECSEELLAFGRLAQRLCFPDERHEWLHKMDLLSGTCRAKRNRRHSPSEPTMDFGDDIPISQLKRLSDTGHYDWIIYDEYFDMRGERPCPGRFFVP